MIERMLGRLLKGVKAGPSGLAWNDRRLASVPSSIALFSAAFREGGTIPLRHAGKGVGDNVSPPLSWTGLPENTASLLLIVEDPDAPLPRPFVHAVVRIEPDQGGLVEGALSSQPADGVLVGRNSFGKRGYAGPRPLPGHGPHAYVFQLFALDHVPVWARPPSRGEALAGLQGRVLARGRLTGISERS